MPPSLEERRPAITPPLALRVAVLGGFALVLFGIVFFRLWFLQVLTGEDYVSQARENRVRKVRIEAPRGDIVDRNGRTLVKTRVAPVVQVVPSQLPDAVLERADAYREARGRTEEARLRAASRLRSLERELNEDGRRSSRSERRERRRLTRASRRAAPVVIPPLPASATAVRSLYRRLGRVIAVSPRAIHERVVEGVAETPYSNVTIKTDVDAAAFNYLRERKERFPGIAVEKLYLRSYPHDELAAQLFGTLREISPDELEQRRYRGVEPGTRIGASGIERSYDSYLRGSDGEFLLAVAVLVLATNTSNLLDLRPGRSVKAFVLLGLGLTLSTQNVEAAASLGIFAAPVLVAGFFDLREKAMFGDAGSNAIGAMAGLWMVLTLDANGQLIALVVLLALNIFGEFRSISAVIEKVPGLRHLDSIGRPK